MVTVDGWKLSVVDGSNTLVSFVAGYTSLRFTKRYRRGGAWRLSGMAGSGVEQLTAGRRLAVSRVQDSSSVKVLEGYVTKIEDSFTDAGRIFTVYGIDDVGLLADRLTLPSPQASFSSQTAEAYWSERGPAEFIIDRLICRNLGMGAQRPRMVADSRIGAETRGTIGKGLTGWRDDSDVGVTWSGQTATAPSAANVRLVTTDAIDLSTTDMATLVGRVTVSGSCAVAVFGYFNTTAAGANVGQAGVVVESSVIHNAADVAASTLWAAEMFRTRNTGKTWVRLGIAVQASGATRTVTFESGTGVWSKAFVGNTVSVNTRFKNLAEEVEDLARAGDVSLTSDTINDLPRIYAVEGSDKTDDVRLSTAVGNVLSDTTITASPEANEVLVAGQGEGTARITLSRSDSASVTEWGRRIERFRDARDVDAADTTLLAQRGDELLADSSRTSGWLVETIDNKDMTWPFDYDLGDEVSVFTGEVASTDVVAAVEAVIDRDGVSVNPVLGSAELADNEPGLYAVVRDLRRRLEQLEGRQ